MASTTLPFCGFDALPSQPGRRTPLKWRDLTHEDKLILTNGCGPKGGFFNPPDFQFAADCNHHDFKYWKGGDWKDRLNADYHFLAAMLADLALMGWSTKMPVWRKVYRLPLHLVAALSYFLAVRTFGARYFHYGEKRGLEDLLLERANFGAKVRGVNRELRNSIKRSASAMLGGRKPRRLHEISQDRRTLGTKSEHRRQVIEDMTDRKNSLHSHGHKGS